MDSVVAVCLLHLLTLLPSTWWNEIRRWVRSRSGKGAGPAGAGPWRARRYHYAYVLYLLILPYWSRRRCGSAGAFLIWSVRRSYCGLISGFSIREQLYSCFKGSPKRCTCVGGYGWRLCFYAHAVYMAVHFFLRFLHSLRSTSFSVDQRPNILPPGVVQVNHSSMLFQAILAHIACRQTRIGSSPDTSYIPAKHVECPHEARDGRGRR